MSFQEVKINNQGGALNLFTHNGVFHADEVSAIALLEVFGLRINVIRVPHKTESFPDTAFVVDIGKKFDGIRLFDHHQNKGGKSSAGLIWDYIGENESYRKISKLVKLIDSNDVGEVAAEPFEFSNMVSCYNSDTVWDDSTQAGAFRKAVEFAKTVFQSYKNMQEKIDATEVLIQKALPFKNFENVLFLGDFIPFWNVQINGIKRPEINAVVWKDNGVWKVQIPPTKPGKMDLNGSAFTSDKTMQFVHANGFFAVADSEEIMYEFLKKQTL